MNSQLPEVDLSKYRNPEDLNKGAGFFKRAVWFLVNSCFLQNSANPSSKSKVILLRLFGAKIGRNVIIKPGLNVKSPWFFMVGDNCMLGERVWIDSLALVSIGKNVCISQDVYMCCGNHDWSDRAFGKTVKPIVVEDGVWIATRATITGGVTLGTHSVVTACSLVVHNTEPYSINSGNPSKRIKQRIIM